MNSTVNRGFNQKALTGQGGMDNLEGGGQNFHMPNSTKNKNYHALVTGATQYN